MSDLGKTFVQGVERIVNKLLKKSVRSGKAINIDTTNGVCDIDLLNGSYLRRVRLQAITLMSGTGIFIEPVNGSIVNAAMVENLEASFVLVQYSQIANLYIKTAEGNVYLNGNGYGGIPIVENLVAKLNRLETAMNTHTHPITGGNSGVSSVQVVPATQVNDLANSNVQHGNGT